jgi:hypothetical protein
MSLLLLSPLTTYDMFFTLINIIIIIMDHYNDRFQHRYGLCGPGLAFLSAHYLPKQAEADFMYHLCPPPLLLPVILISCAPLLTRELLRTDWHS